MRVSIITPVFNHWDDVTRPYVNSLLSKITNRNGIEFEFIIINNGSTDETEKELRKIADKRLVATHCNKNKGFSCANNIGFALSRGEVVIFLNNDVLFENDFWVYRCLDELAKEKHSIVGAEKIESNHLTRFDLSPVSYLNGWCLASYRKTLEALIASDETREKYEVFDEGFGIAYFEDVELSYLARSNNIHLKTISNCGLIHLGSKTSHDQIPIEAVTKKARGYYLGKMMYHHLKKINKKRVVFFVPDVPYEFIDSDYEGKGVGGSEASLILLCRELARLGYFVEVYNNTKTTGTFNGVVYKNISEFIISQHCDVFVLFRSFSPVLHYVHCDVKIFWSCDQYTDAFGTWNTQVFPYVDKIVAISPYHAQYLSSAYPNAIKENIVTIELGINIKDYKQKVNKVSGKAIFCSVPQRGLDRLLRIVPQVKKRVPWFHLVITSDYTLWGGSPNNEEYIHKAKEYSFVTFLGKVPRKQLVQQQLESQVMAYPSAYDECFCVSAMECIAAGAVPVVVGRGALPTTVGTSGIVLSSFATDEDYVESLTRVLVDDRVRKRLEDDGKQRAVEYSWEHVAKRWSDLFCRELERKNTMIHCAVCQKKMVNSFTLHKHMAKRHPEVAADTSPQITTNDLPTHTILEFSREIDVTINGQNFSGKTIRVPYEYVDSVVDVAREAYGSDVI